MSKDEKNGVSAEEGIDQPDVLGAAAPRLSVTDEIEFPQFPYTIFVDKLLEARFPHARTFQWTTGVETLDEVLPFAIATGRDARTHIALLDLEPVVGAECLTYVWLRLGSLYGHIAAHSCRSSVRPTSG